MTDVLVALGASLILAFVLSGPRGRAHRAEAAAAQTKAPKAARAKAAKTSRSE